MDYHCNSCGATRKSAKAMDRHIVRCNKKQAKKIKKGK